MGEEVKEVEAALLLFSLNDKNTKKKDDLLKLKSNETK